MSAPHLVDGVWVAECDRCHTTQPTDDLEYERSVIDNDAYLPGEMACSDRAACATRRFGISPSELS